MTSRFIYFNKMFTFVKFTGMGLSPYLGLNGATRALQRDPERSAAQPRSVRRTERLRICRSRPILHSPTPSGTEGGRETLINFGFRISDLIRASAPLCSSDEKRSGGSFGIRWRVYYYGAGDYWRPVFGAGLWRLFLCVG